ncbi:MAG: hypothetical protein LUD47_04620 [Clostridia bacterium]|nr:hypothetical protein [Clostridia bacterium]
MAVEILEEYTGPARHADIAPVQTDKSRGRIRAEEKDGILYVSVETGETRSKNALCAKFMKAIEYAADRGYGDVLFQSTAYEGLGISSSAVYRALTAAHDSLYDKMDGQLTVYLCTEGARSQWTESRMSVLLRSCLDMVKPPKEPEDGAGWYKPNRPQQYARRVSSKVDEEILMEYSIRPEFKCSPKFNYDMAEFSIAPRNDDFIEDTVSKIKNETPDAMSESFSAMLFRLLDEKGVDEVSCYKKANIDRRLFSKMRNTSYTPSKKTAISLAVALELSLDETTDFLLRAGFALSPQITFDRVVTEFISHGDYNIYDLNEALYLCGLGTLSDRGKQSV